MMASIPLHCCHTGVRYVDRVIRAVLGRGETYLLEEHDQPRRSNTLGVIPRPHDIPVLGELARPHALLLLGRQCGERLGKVPLLEQALGLDLAVLDLDKLVVGGQAAQVRQGGDGLVVAVLLDQPAGREGEPPDAQGEAHGGNALDDGRQLPGQVGLRVALAANVVTRVADPERQHDAEDGGELIE